MRITLISIALLMLLISCEQTVDVELPYDKQIVVNSFVGHRTIDMAWISKTLPVNEEFTAEKCFIDADVRIHWRDTSYRLVADYAELGYVLPVSDERWQGDSMRMTVDWDGLHAEATARMPRKPESIVMLWEPHDFDPEYGSLTAQVVCESGTVIWANANARGYFSAGTPMQFYGRYETVPNVGNNDVVTREFYVGGLSREEAEAAVDDSIFVEVFLADIDYERYLVEPSSRQDGPFGFGGKNPYFNVKGDGIGLFVPVCAVSQYVRLKIK